MMPPAVATLIDGEPADTVSVRQRALQYGDGLFETISCVAGAPRWLARHLQRLTAGCARLQIPFAHTQAEALITEVQELAGGQGRCIVKVIVSRGEARLRGYRPAGDERVTRIVSRHPWGEESASAEALRVGLSDVRLGINPRLAGIKHLNRLEQVLAQLDKPAGLDEVLMCTSDGELISGSMSNLFLVDAQGLFTPSVERCGVAGVMRALVLEAAAVDSAVTAGSAGPVELRSVDVAGLAAVREAFLTNVRWGIRSIGVLDGRRLPSDDYAQWLRRRMDASEV